MTVTASSLGIERHIVAFERSHEGFCHAVGLRAFNWRPQRKKADIARIPPRVGRCVAGAVSVSYSKSWATG